MTGWKAKFVFLVIVYVAGFASAIYWLGPATENQTAGVGVLEKDFSCPNLNSQEIAASFNKGVRKCIDFGKSAALRTAELIREKYKKNTVTDESRKMDKNIL